LLEVIATLQARRQERWRDPSEVGGEAAAVAWELLEEPLDGHRGNR
jgi:hypothetical protein